MGVHHSLYSGVTGLSANSDGMSVIANNIANANTRSFKSDRAEFEDLLSLSVNEGISIGRGSRLRNITTDFSQGALSPTGGITDLGIQGEGFFITSNDRMEVKKSNSVFYTRQGSFHFSKEGFLEDVMGGKIMGYMADNNGKLSSKLSPLQLTGNSVPPVSTSVIDLAVNLDTRERIIDEKFDTANPGLTSNFSSTVPIFDNMGTIHQCTIYFSKKVAGDDGNVWEWNATVDGREMKNKTDLDKDGNYLPAIVGSGTIVFNEEGKPIMKYKNKDDIPTYIDTIEQEDAIEMQFDNGAIPQKIQFNFGPQEDENGNIGTQMSTSQAAASTTFYHSQNGYESGYLKAMKIDLDGSIRGIFTNGVERRLASVAIATFANPDGMQKIGRNSYIAPPNAGSPRIGTPQSGSRGSIYASSLEESNVDLAREFVNMITTQRAFQANSKSITTTDSMLEEIINLKR